MASRKSVGLVLAAAVLAGVGGYAWWQSRQHRLRREGAALVERRTLAVGLLEDAGDIAGDELQQACEAFAALHEALPDELLPVRNLAIGRLLYLKNSDDPDVEPALEAMNQLLAADNSADAIWLAAQILRYAQRDRIEGPYIEKAVELLKEALRTDADLAERDVRLRYLLFRYDENHSDPQRRLEALSALRAAYERAPHNLYLLINLLPALAAAESSDLPDVLRDAKQTVAPLRESLLFQKSVDIHELADRAIAAAEQQDWDRSRLLARQLGNFVRVMEALRRDYVALDPHPLEFVVYDFTDAFYDRWNPLPPPTPEPIAVAWAASGTTALEADVVALSPLDFDLDTRTDVAVVTARGLSIWDTAGTHGWRLVAEAQLADLRGVVVGDLDDDRIRVGPGGRPYPRDRHESDVDLVAFGDGGTTVLRNQLDEASGRRTLEPVPQDVELPAAGAGLLLDVDSDADLDLVLAGPAGIEVFSNRGNATFERSTAWSQLPTPNIQVTALAAVDWDRDVDIDVLVASPQGSGVLENLRHGRLRWLPLPELAEACPEPQTIDPVEWDGNASWDVLSGGATGLSVARTATPQSGQIRFLETQRASAVLRGATPADLDNDGRMDAVGWTDESLIWFRAADSGVTTERPEPFRLTGVVDCRAWDVDDDGDLDLLVARGRRVDVIRNDGGNRNGWLQVRAVGQSDNAGRAGNTGLGSVVEVRSGTRYQAHVVAGQVTHFGLGAVSQADALRVLWTNGIPQVQLEPPADQVLCERMTLKGSCPYIYTWTGERFEFLTDCLWAAPIGLQAAPGRQAPSRSWEYLKIPGDRLAPRDGELTVQLTEELWEAAYFDHVQLIAVDHPADAAVYSNEKVGPESIAFDHIHTVTAPRTPAAARDSQGRDVLEPLARRDGVYLQPFARRIRQGLTETHFVELDLGELSEPQSIKLFLTGWIYPTNTSLNLAFAQHPERNGPRLPSLWTPDDQGRWVERQAYMGFPGGKTKTIVVDASDAFPAGDYRVRIQSSAEICWDEMFFTVDEPDVEVRRTPLRLVGADLHYRGFSRKIPYRDNAPEAYVYEDVSTTPCWPPMRGEFTRYGDVAELLAEDDRLVVLGSGDELTVRFAAAAPPPSGWTRDYLLHCVGWDKDADLNTIHGQSVGPLPFRAMTQYPAVRDPQASDAADYDAYLRTHQTRRAPSGEFWRLLHSDRWRRRP